jgi:hypothetical protein
MKGVILQPTYLPWLGYFEMIAAADIFVIYDHVQFVKKSWHHRNRIKGPNGEILLSVPTKKAPLHTALCNIDLASEYEASLTSHWTTISHAYKKAPYFSRYSQELQALYFKKYASLTDLTVTFIHFFCEHLGVSTKFITSSSFALDTSLVNSTGKVVELCQKVGIKNLYDANGALKIIDTKIFNSNGIGIEFQQYEHPIYSQQFGKFIPYMSVLDLLLNEGENSANVMRAGRRPPLEILIN